MKSTNTQASSSSVLAGRVFPGPARLFSMPRVKALDLEESRRELKKAQAVRYAWTHIGQPYRWGGDDPIHGYDCSGLVVEILTAVGIFPHRYDSTAGGLFGDLKAKGCRELEAPIAGAVIVYFDKTGFCCHTEFAVDELHTIGASGGGSSTTDLEAAAQQNAFVKLRPWNYRGQPAKIIDPFSAPPRVGALRTKAAATDIIAILAAVAGLIPGLFKKKTYTVWQWKNGAWIDQGSYSKRQAQFVVENFVKIGQDRASFWIARKGAKPPTEGPKNEPPASRG